MSNTALAQVETTNVVGYFNANTWPVNLTISELNLMTIIQPKEFVRDRSGNKLNDPILERFCAPKMLQRELSDKPIVVRRIAPLRPAVQPDPYAHPVRSGVKDAKGKWGPAPALPAPAPTTTSATAATPNATTTAPALPSPSVSSVRGMSIEEAKRLGFIGKQRLVDENFGLDATTNSNARGEHIPNIKISYENTPPVLRGKNTSLPENLVNDAKAIPAAASLVQAMEKAAAVDPEAVPNLTESAAVEVVREIAGDDGVQKFQEAKQQLVAPKPVVAAPVAPAPAPKNVRVASPVKPAVAEAAPVKAATIAKPAALPPPQLDEQPAAVAPAEIAEAVPVNTAPAPAETKAKRQCPACDYQAEYPSHIKRHIKNRHKDQVEALLAQVG